MRTEAAERRRCTRCKRKPAPPYQEWCVGCYRAWRRDRLRRLAAADPEFRTWRRVWQRLRMRAYRGHAMQEEACRTCGTKPANLLLLAMTPLRWVWLCRPCRERQYPNRTVIGRPKKPPRRETKITRTVAAEARRLGL